MALDRLQEVDLMLAINMKLLKVEILKKELAEKNIALPAQYIVTLADNMQ